MDLGLYVITQSVPELGRDHYDVAAAAIEGGASAIQMRVKKRPMGEALKIANAIHLLTREAGIPLIINDHVGIAMASRAEGLHLGPDDISIPVARRMLGTEIIIGSSCSKPADAIKAERDGADYIGLGPIYTTDTKPGKPETGVARITKVKTVVGLPVIAIGGINPNNLVACIEAGADGIAVVSAVTMADEMIAATSELRQALDDARKGGRKPAEVKRG